MSDWISAHITIGGRVARSVVPDLWHLISEQRLGLDWGEYGFQPQSAEDLLAACREIAGAKLLRLYDESACYGNFSELQAFLADRQIAFDRWHDSKYEIAAELLMVRPELESFSFLTDRSERILIPAQPLLSMLPDIQQIQRDLSRGDVRKASELVRNCLANLTANLPPAVPPLTSLEFIADVPTGDRR